MDDPRDGFRPGDRVRYVPTHAKGDPNHRDCAIGVVARVTKDYVFVRFSGITPQACKPHDLLLEIRS